MRDKALNLTKKFSQFIMANGGVYDTSPRYSLMNSVGQQQESIADLQFRIGAIDFILAFR